MVLLWGETKGGRGGVSLQRGEDTGVGMGLKGEGRWLRLYDSKEETEITKKRGCHKGSCPKCEEIQ